MLLGRGILHRKRWQVWSVVCGRWSKACAAIACLVLTGCSTAHLDSARENYYLGHFTNAVEDLSEMPGGKTDRVLFLMERATMRQAAGQYAESAEDWQEAKALAEELDYYSVTKGTTSFAVNDRVLAFRGAPYERTLLHSFSAKSYLAQSLWDDAAVEARNIIDRLENLNGYPDDAYSRYMAGFCMELIFDYDAASRQYRAADNLLKDVKITESGHLSASRTQTTSNQQPITTTSSAAPAELVVFIALGRAPSAHGATRHNWRYGANPDTEILCDGKPCGPGFTLADTQSLLADTESRRAALKATKTVTRIALKEAAAQAVGRENEFLGELVRLILFAMETPDDRQWETLPRWLQVARVPCPRELKSYVIVIKGSNGQILERLTVSDPLVHRGTTYVSFIRVF